ncbi:hypothetical protein D3C80_1246020 [compost metagenome]
MAVLRLGERRGGDPAAVTGGCVDSEAAPAAANFQQVIVRAQFELLADALQLVQLGLLQCLPRVFELRSRIHHGGVQQPLEQGIAQVVVGQNVAPGTTLVVAVEPVQQAQGRAAQAGQAALERVEHFKVGDEQAGHQRQVGAAPIAVNVGFASTDRAIAGDQAPGGVIEDLHLGLQRAVGITETPLLPVAEQAQVAVTQLAQLGEHGASCQPAEQWRKACELANAQGGI